MQKPIAAILLAAASCCAIAGAADAPDTAPPPGAPAGEPPAVEPVEPGADQAAMEMRALQDPEPFAGPRFGKSRVERRREKCQAQADEQRLQGPARERHLQACVKR